MPNPRLAIATILLTSLLATPPAPAQAVTAVPTLDLTRTMGVWYEIARYPIHRERLCLSDEMVLYSLGDKRNSFQLVTSCQVRQDYTNSWNARGKMDPAGDGKLRLASLWPFHTNYWVLAIDPAYQWALVGTPNRKSLWLLSKTTALAPDLVTQIEAQAAARGFNTARLIKITQH
jgi:apolipoprotein D and lipocalin family protein